MDNLNPQPKGFDLAGAARDHQQRVRRWARRMSEPDVVACYGLIARNPAIASAVLQAIQAELAQLPDGGVGLDEPLSFS